MMLLEMYVQVVDSTLWHPSTKTSAITTRKVGGWHRFSVEKYPDPRSLEWSPRATSMSMSYSAREEQERDAAWQAHSPV